MGSHVPANAATMRGIAEKLVAPGVGKPPARSSALSLYLGQIRPNLLVLMGSGGFRALVARALFLVSRDFPEFRHVTPDDDGNLIGLEEACSTLDDAGLREVFVSILTEILLLLFELLGAGVTLAVIGDTWPQTLPDDIDLSHLRKP